MDVNSNIKNVRGTIMSLIQQIPKEFYKLFRTKNRDSYIGILVDLYKANMEEYNVFGMSKSLCRDLINETMVRLQIIWQEDEEEKDAPDTDGQMEMRTPASRSLNNLLKWGWLREEYDEQLNEEILTFPEYSQMFVELFWELSMDSDSQERESIMAIYSLLYTFHKDKDHNNDILKNAWKSSRRLTLMLTNMQDGMRGYFDRLSAQKNFIGIQKTLIDELNNSDSKKYAMLTTTDSFYRYKEQVKELISDILEENEDEEQELTQKFFLTEPDSKEARILERKRKMHEETSEYIIRIEREFDSIEKKYTTLIEQKSIFAQRALARVHFLMQEGMEDNENVATFIKMLTEDVRGNYVLEDFSKNLQFSKPHMQLDEKSLYQKRNNMEKAFEPKAVKVPEEQKEELSDFVPQPLYSGKELQEFREKNTIGGRFVVTEDSVQSMEDLEKLMLLWQQVTRETGNEENQKIILGREIKKDLDGKQNVTYTRLEIEEDTDV